MVLLQAEHDIYIDNTGSDEYFGGVKVEKKQIKLDIGHSIMRVMSFEERQELVKSVFEFLRK